MKEWFSAKELENLPGMPKTVQGIIFKAKKESWLKRPRVGKGGGFEYHISSLPEETRIALLKQAASVPQPPMMLP